MQTTQLRERPPLLETTCASDRIDNEGWWKLFPILHSASTTFVHESHEWWIIFIFVHTITDGMENQPINHVPVWCTPQLSQRLRSNELICVFSFYLLAVRCGYKKHTVVPSNHCMFIEWRSWNRSRQACLISRIYYHIHGFENSYLPINFRSTLV